MTLTEYLVDYVFELKKKDIDAEVSSIVKTFFVDCLGYIITGAQAKPFRIALEFCKSMYREKLESTVLATGE